MIDKLREITQNHPIVRKILSMVYQKTLAPFMSGHAQYYIKYFFTIKSEEIKKLSSYGLTDLKPYCYRQWRIGKEKDHAYRRYYTGLFNERKVFVKIGKYDMTVANEYRVMLQMQKDPLDFTATMICGDDQFDEDTVMIAVEFILELEEFQIPNTYNDFEEICSQFYIILCALEEHRIIHSDIHAGNLMLQQGKLFLLDYGISKIDGIDNKINYVARPGTFYKLTKTGRRYDDAYSFVKLMERINIPKEWKDCPAYKAIESRVDKYYVDVVLS